jgi:ribose/xylose/arabinose/galactoside ABC-type transport system permease subunit
MSHQHLAKLKIRLPDVLAMELLGIYSKELKAYVYTETCTCISIAALLIIAKLGNNQDIFQ